MLKKEREMIEWIINTDVNSIFMRSIKENWTQKKFEKILKFKMAQSLEKIAEKKVNLLEI